MERITRKFGKVIFVLVVLGFIYVAFQFLFMDFAVDSWWFNSIGYSFYFWQRAMYRYLILSGATLIFFVIFFVNFWMTSKVLTKPESSTASTRKINKMVESFRYGSLSVYTPLAFILALVLAYPLYAKWEESLLFFFSSSSGVKDAFFSKDVSFYLFSLPIYRLMEKRLAITFLIMTGVTFLLYILEVRLIRKNFDNFSFPRGVRIHLSLLLLGLVILSIWHLLLKRYELVYVNTHKVFYGPGFVEMNIHLPLIWITVILLGLTGFNLIVFFNTGKFWKFFVLLVVLSICSYGTIHTDFIGERVQKYIVRPNEISKEAPYIARSVKSTLAAYGLENIDTKEFRPSHGDFLEKASELKDIVRNTPVWDHNLLHDVYKQLQGLRSYYDFIDVDVDRYNIKGLYQQVFVAARELSIEKLPDNAKNWVNLHMKYTHGHGVVMTPAIQGGEEPFIWFVRDLPPRSDYGIAPKQSSIYYGEGLYPYSVVPNKLGEVGYPQGESTSSENYSGTGGVPLSSFIRKAVFALYFKERNIFFTTSTTHDSKILFRRNIVEIVKKITPFLMLDKDPYPVVTKERIFWIQDAYTISNKYPGAEPFKDTINYIRNSVKIVIDAYNGSITYYIVAKDDPIIQAYHRAYPGFFKNISDMPEEIKAHIRFPKDMFEIQMFIFAKYHQRDPENFYKQEDAWIFARTFKNAEKTIHPYYLTLNIFDPKKVEFLLVQPFSPKGLDILRAIVTVSCDGPNYGKITVLTFPKEIQIYGPSQVEAMIDQDTYVSQQLTLWNQIGSSVERGNIVILPYAGAILYIQPLYLKAASGLKIPELKRIIISYEDMVVMDVSLETALNKLIENIQSREKLYRERLKRFSGEKGSEDESLPNKIE